MAGPGHTPEGRFARGNKWGKGRPPRNYSIAHAMSVYAEEGTTTDDGESLTRAQWAAKWLWGVVTSGQDRGKEVGFKDRLSGLQTILSRIEPMVKLTETDIRNMSEGEAEEVVRNLESLSDEELKVLEKLGVKGKK